MDALEILKRVYSKFATGANNAVALPSVQRVYAFLEGDVGFVALAVFQGQEDNTHYSLELWESSEVHRLQCTDALGLASVNIVLIEDGEIRVSAPYGYSLGSPLADKAIELQHCARELFCGVLAG